MLFWNLIKTVSLLKLTFVTVCTTKKEKILRFGHFKATVKNVQTNFKVRHILLKNAFFIIYDYL